MPISRSIHRGPALVAELHDGRVLVLHRGHVILHLPNDAGNSGADNIHPFSVMARLARSCFVVPMRLDRGFASAEDGAGPEGDHGERAARQRKGRSTSADAFPLRRLEIVDGFDSSL